MTQWLVSAVLQQQELSEKKPVTVGRRRCTLAQIFFFFLELIWGPVDRSTCPFLTAAFRGKVCFHLRCESDIDL